MMARRRVPFAACIVRPGVKWQPGSGIRRALRLFLLGCLLSLAPGTGLLSPDLRRRSSGLLSALRALGLSHALGSGLATFGSLVPKPLHHVHGCEFLLARHGCPSVTVSKAPKLRRQLSW